MVHRFLNYIRTVPFLKIQHQQYRIIRTALNLRQSTPINNLLAESCKPSLEFRFALLSTKYIFKCFAKNLSLVVHSFHRLEIESSYSSRQRRIQLLKSVPIFIPYILQKYSTKKYSTSFTVLCLLPYLRIVFLLSFLFHSMLLLSLRAPLSKGETGIQSFLFQKFVKNFGILLLLY